MMRILLLTVAIAWCPLATLNAAMVISVKNTTMTAGGSSTVDVYLTGDTDDILGRFGYEFNITGATAGSGDLQFSVVQSMSEQTQSGPSPYVFFSDTDPDNFIATRGSGGGDPYTLVGSDLLATLDSVSIAGEFLLARLEVQHVGPFSPGSYDFEVSLNVLSQQTLFDRDWDAETDTNYFSNEFSSTSGIVTVNAGTAAVPEPSSAMLFVAGPIALWLRRRKTQRAAA